MKKLNNSGDTIVEVLISLAILGLVIGTSYAIASRSLKSAQQAQERTQATKLAEGQTESIKYLSESSNTTDEALFKSAIQARANSMKCVNSIKDESGQKIIQIDDDKDNNCKYEATIFKRSFWYDTDKHIFTIIIVWDSLGSTVTENVTIQYRVVQ